MKAVVTTGTGGYEKLKYCDVPVPEPGKGEVLIQVLAAGVNNTDINTRLGWYSAEDSAGEGWSGPVPFPLIQGTDCCGRVVAAGTGAGEKTIGMRVLVRPCIRKYGFDSMETVWMGSDFNGSFAQYLIISESEVFPVNCGWSNEELATIPCSYGTAENMLHKVNVCSGNHVLVAGASGGVGSAVIQLAKRRGAHVTAITGKEKISQVLAAGADCAVARDDNLFSVIRENSIDVIVDNVAGQSFGNMLKTLKRGGRYVSSGAIAGPIVNFDMRSFYLKDITMTGTTAWDKPVFRNLITYIEKGELQPLLAKTFPLENIAEAQREFLKKKHVGKIVLIPLHGVEYI